MAPDVSETDGQDIAEVFDEDNLDSDSMRIARDDEELNFDDMPDVLDVTKADGDEDDDEAIIGDDLDDNEIVELSLEVKWMEKRTISSAPNPWTMRTKRTTARTMWAWRTPAT
jgi:hypothetical protein